MILSNRPLRKEETAKIRGRSISCVMVRQES
jgi:hypothetical protein